jgi:hypothetical protein
VTSVGPFLRRIVKLAVAALTLAALAYAAFRAVQALTRRTESTGGDREEAPGKEAPGKEAPGKEARSEPVGVWVEPADGACPVSHPVKAKLSSGIFHVPGGMNYDRTKPDRCYVDTAAAEADGLRASKM